MDGVKPAAGLMREQRLAAQLRANLRRRKQQARALDQQRDEAPDDPAPDKPPMASSPLVKPVGDG